MAKEEVVRLFRASQQDSDLRDRLNQSPDIQSFVRTAKDYGYDFTIREWQDVTKFSVEEIAGELSEIPGL